MSAFPENFAVPDFRAPWLAPYWDGVKAGELRLPRCSGCGNWQWYPLESGPCCPGARFEWQALAPTARVFTFTKVCKPLLPGVTEPYFSGLVVPDDAPDCRIPSRLVAESESDIAINAPARFDVADSAAGLIPFFRIEVSL